MPVLGGSPRQLIWDVDTAVSFSPDGKQFAFMRGTGWRGTPSNSTEIRIANADGSGDHLLATLPGYLPFPLLRAAWSPDGKTLVAPNLLSKTERRWVLNAINVVDGQVRELYSGSEAVGQPAWLPDGRALLVPFDLPKENRTQLWLIDYPGGEKHRLTNDLSNYGVAIDLTRDGQRLVALEQRQTSHIWVVPAGPDGRGRKQITSGESPDSAVAPGPAGKLLVRTRGSDVVLINEEGSQRTLLVPELHNSVSMSSCGDRHVVLDVRAGTKMELSAYGFRWLESREAGGERYRFTAVHRTGNG